VKRASIKLNTDKKKSSNKSSTFSLLKPFCLPLWKEVEGEPALKKKIKTENGEMDPNANRKGTGGEMQIEETKQNDSHSKVHFFYT